MKGRNPCEAHLACSRNGSGWNECNSEINFGKLSGLFRVSEYKILTCVVRFIGL